MNTKRFATIQDAIDSITPAFGDYADDFDVDAIAAEAFEYRVDTNEAGQQLLDTAGFEDTTEGDADAFWAIAAKYDRSN